MAEGPPERGGRAPVLRLRQGVDGRPARENFGFRDSGVSPGGPNWPRVAAALPTFAAPEQPQILKSSAMRGLFFFVWRRCVMLVGGWRRRRENPGAHGQAQVPCFLNSRGDLGSANAALRLWQQRFCSCFRNGKWGLLAPRCWLRCAALRPGRARGGNFGF